MNNLFQSNNQPSGGGLFSNMGQQQNTQQQGMGGSLFSQIGGQQQGNLFQQQQNPLQQSSFANLGGGFQQNQQQNTGLIQTQTNPQGGMQTGGNLFNTMGSQNLGGLGQQQLQNSGWMNQGGITQQTGGGLFSQQQQPQAGGLFNMIGGNQTATNGLFSQPNQAQQGGGLGMQTGLGLGMGGLTQGGGLFNVSQPQGMGQQGMGMGQQGLGQQVMGQQLIGQSVMGQQGMGGGLGGGLLFQGMMEQQIGTMNTKFDLSKCESKDKSKINAICAMKTVKHFQDMSNLELRLQDYQLIKNNQITPEVQQLIQNSKNQMNNPMNQGGFMGQQMGGQGLLQQQQLQTSSSLFNQSQNKPGGLFQQSQLTLGGQSGGLFNSMPQQQQQPFNQQQTGGLFQQNQTGGGLFSQSNTSNPQGGLSLGGGLLDQNKQQLGSSLFQQQPQMGQQSGGLFQQNQQSSSVLSGLQPQQNTGSLFNSFGNSQQPSGLFSNIQPGQQQQQSGGLTGGLQQQQNQPQTGLTQGGSLFSNLGGGTTQQQSQTQTGGLFSGLTNGSNQQNTGSSLFANLNQPQTSQQQTGGLFPNLTAPQVGQQSQSVGLFSNLGQSQNNSQVSQPVMTGQSQTAFFDQDQNQLFPVCDWQEQLKKFQDQSNYGINFIKIPNQMLYKTNLNPRIQKISQKKKSIIEEARKLISSRQSIASQHFVLDRYNSEQEFQEKLNDQQSIRKLLERHITVKILIQHPQKKTQIYDIKENQLILKFKKQILKNIDLIGYENSYSLLWKQENGMDILLNDEFSLEKYGIEDNAIIQLIMNENQQLDDQIRLREELDSADDILPILTRPGYKMDPSVFVLQNWTEEQLQKVKNFSVSNKYGKIRWLDTIDVRGLNLDKIININDKVVEMYSDYSDDNKPFIGEELNKPAEITFFNIQVPLKNGVPVTCSKFIKKIQKWAEQNDMKLIDYFENEEKLVVQVDNF